MFFNIFFNRILPANNAIIKPPSAHLNQLLNNREIEEAMKKVKEASSLIAAVAEPGKLAVYIVVIKKRQN